MRNYIECKVSKYNWVTLYTNLLQESHNREGLDLVKYLGWYLGGHGSKLTSVILLC